MSFKVGDRVRIRGDELTSGGCVREITLHKCPYRVQWDEGFYGVFNEGDIELDPRHAPTARPDPSIPLRFAGLEVRLTKDEQCLVGPYITFRECELPEELSQVCNSITLCRGDELDGLIEWLTAVREEVGK